MIELSQVSFSYTSASTPDTGRRKRRSHAPVPGDASQPIAAAVLSDVSLTIPSGAFVGIAGQTGSGKTTLLMLMAGLVRPTTGSVSYGAGWTRTDIGLMFQYPERQLFSQSVLDDVAFGPKMQGRTDEEARADAAWALCSCELPESLWQANPFRLSGGEQRRAAFAGVLALRPQALLLDEPTAGLDQQGRAHLMAHIARLRQDGMTVVAASHDLDFLAQTDRIAVLRDGHLLFQGKPEAVLTQRDALASCGLAAPFAVELAYRLREGGLALPTYCPDERALAKAIADELA